MNETLKAFYDQLVASAQVERAAGRISLSEALIIRSLRFRPAKLHQVFSATVEELCCDHAFVQACMVGPVVMEGDLAEQIIAGQFKVDWEKLGDFIVKILPAILQILALFL